MSNRISKAHQPTSLADFTPAEREVIADAIRKDAAEAVKPRKVRS